ncbi:hypothetical protein [Nesterenkonia rhizosphaerae]|uniref:Uncharacterized protein n=1 Tax=Nesterenkonia rhizosphaerae TaxID=1348272 RepID=A0ABP9G0G5_9MICC
MNAQTPGQQVTALVTRPSWATQDDTADRRPFADLEIATLNPDPRYLPEHYLMPGESRLLVIELAPDLALVAGSHAGSTGPSTYQHSVKPNIAATAIMHSHAPGCREITLHGDVVFVGGYQDQMISINPGLADGLVAWLNTSEAEENTAAGIGAHRH